MSTDVQFRKHVVDALKPLLPRRWKWFDYNTGLDEITSTTLVLNLVSISRFGEAPLSQRLAEYRLTIYTPSGNPETREDDLDDSIIDLLNAIDDSTDIAWSLAERGQSGSNLGFDVTLTVPFQRVPVDAEGA